jgi:hypothetical protein
MYRLVVHRSPNKAFVIFQRAASTGRAPFKGHRSWLAAGHRFETTTNRKEKSLHDLFSPKRLRVDNSTIVLVVLVHQDLPPGELWDAFFQKVVSTFTPLHFGVDIPIHLTVDLVTSIFLLCTMRKIIFMNDK